MCGRQRGYERFVRVSDSGAEISSDGGHPSRVFSYEWQGKDLRGTEFVRVASKGLTKRYFCASVQWADVLGAHAPVATGSMRNVLRTGEILAPRGADDGRSSWLREYTRGCGGKEGRNGDTVSDLGMKITASVTICQVRN